MYQSLVITTRVNRVAISWLLTGYWLAMGCLWAYLQTGYPLAIGWLVTGHQVALPGYWLAIDWLSAIYQLALGWP